ncbi:hypothetical protein HDV04_001473 [Boothiomyces sp. JEL0838]|nr:hypothetical protein HDV04_001473 [Boothiomyces sp. JEL0838]
MVSNVSIRPAVPSDVALLTELNGGHEMNFESMMSLDFKQPKSKCIFVAETDCKLVGYLMAGTGYPPYFNPCDSLQIYIMHIMVKEEYRKARIGTQLLKFLEQESLKSGIHLIRTECDGRKEWLVRWYHKLGFQTVEYTGDRKEEFKASGQIVLYNHLQ